jgi:CRP/FNR family cyclic AMP-dependent transcriptional regulator
MTNQAHKIADLLSGLPDVLASGLFATARQLKLKADQTLFVTGDPGDGCYRIDAGLIKVSVLSPSGSERILAILGPGAIVGELALLDDRARSASVAAVRDSELSFVSRPAFNAFADKNPEVYRHMMAMLVQRLRDTNNVVLAASFLSLKGRVAQALLGLGDAFGHEVAPGRMLIRQKVTQSDIAAMAGIARENVSRILNDWMRRKIVTRLSGYYCLEDRAALEAEVEL